MRDLRHVAVLAAAFALSAAPAARASAVVTPVHTIAGTTPGQLLLESWTQLLSTPATDNPIVGHCESLAGGRVQAPIGGFGFAEINCTVRQGVPLFVRFGAFCSSLEGVFTNRAQLACAHEAVTDLTAVTIAVDGGRPVNMLARRFEIDSPQGIVRLPPDNLLEAPPQRITLSAFAWGVLIDDLSPGRHHLLFTFAAGADQVSIPSTIDVVRC
jgi:hypothetical protein